MNFSQNLTPFFIGWGIGFIGSVLGALLQYRFINKKGGSIRLPNFIFPVTGILGIIGFAAIIISLFTGSIAPAISVGIGVVTGFFVGFLVVIVFRTIIVKRNENEF